MLDPKSEHPTDTEETYGKIVLTQRLWEATGGFLFVSRLVTENAKRVEISSDPCGNTACAQVFNLLDQIGTGFREAQ